MALVGKASASCDLGQARSPVPKELDRALQSQMHHITVRRHADRSSEYACEVEWAAPRDSRERGDFDRFVQVGNDVVIDPVKDLFAQRTSCPVCKS